MLFARISSSDFDPARLGSRQSGRRTDPPQLELGEVGFVFKQAAGSELLKSIDRVLAGKDYVIPKLRPEDWVAAKTRARQYTKELTPRQRGYRPVMRRGTPSEGDRRSLVLE